MATSAQTLTNILKTVSEQFQIDYDTLFNNLKDKELLPKKLTTVKQITQKNVSIYASKAAEELAIKSGFTPSENSVGSGKGNKFTISDIKKLMEVPIKKNIAISPNALNFANENNININDIVGSGSNGRILLKDVEDFHKLQSENIPKSDDNDKQFSDDDELFTQTGQDDNDVNMDDHDKKKHEDENQDEDEEDEEEDEAKKYNISPRALLEINKLNISKKNIKHINGTGKNGLITKEDVIKYANSIELQ